MKNDAFRGLDIEIKNRIHWLHGRRFYFSGKPKEILYLIQHAQIRNYDKGVIERMNFYVRNNNNLTYLFYFDKEE